MKKLNVRLAVYLVVAGLALGLMFIRPEPGYAGEPSQEPVLRIETGMHTAMIVRIGIDAKNRYLVTGSHDKTARVWELATGRLIKVLRPPIGEGDEGKLYAVALAPDGQTVACGGLTGYAWDSSYSIYLFDLQSGGMMKRITGLPNAIFHLVYSRDGRFLVATLGGQNGIRIYRTSDYSPISEDKDYGAYSYGADSGVNDRLVTTCYDGFIRLYDQDFRLLFKKKARGGNQPYQISFSPDGSKIAVGFKDSIKVDVVSDKDLSYLYSPDTSGVNGDLGRVAWSSDGKFLYAGGMYSKNGCPIRKWVDSGKGNYTDLPAADNTIMHILPLKDGGLVFGAADPAFGVFDAVDERIVRRVSSLAQGSGQPITGRILSARS